MRLFIGLPLSSDAQRSTASAAQRCAKSIPGRYTLPENYHMTLAFLGEATEKQLEQAKDALFAFAARFPAPSLTLDALSYFRQAPNAILIRSVTSPDDLAAIHEMLLSLLSAYGLPHTDGPFSPHVTLARHADLTQADLGALHTAPVSFIAPEALLYLSARDESGVLRYTPLARAPFSQKFL